MQTHTDSILAEGGGDLAALLQHLMARTARRDADLARLTGIPARTIEKWRRGEVRRPRLVTDLLKLAQTLVLDAAETTALLTAAGHPPLEVLRQQAHEMGHLTLAPLLAAWPVAAPAVAAADVAPELPPRHQLRPPVADFVGRVAEAAQLVQALRTAVAVGSGAIISAIQGMAGIGKTELAYVLAHHLRDAFPDAQIMLHLRGSSGAPLTAVQALHALIRTFARDAKLPDDLDALERHYCAVLHGQRVLILADDARDAAQVRPLVPPNGCALLITSRTRFTLPGMASVQLEQLGAAEAVALLRSICPRLRTGEAQAIARACGELPLALRISGGILHNDPALASETYLSRLTDARQRLAQLRDPDDTGLDVAAALALSYAQLDAATQQVFRQLGVVVADFTTGMALAVGAGAARVDVEAVLRLLLRRNLVMYDSARVRWRLHDLVRDLARQYLEAAGEWEAAMWRYAQVAVQIAAGAQAQYDAAGADMLAALASFDAERAHINAAWTWALAQARTWVGDRLLLEAALATSSIGELRYDNREVLIPQLEQALRAARRFEDQSGEGAILNALGCAYANVGEARRAIAHHEQALACVRAAGDRHREGHTLRNLGRVYGELGDAPSAIPYYEQALASVRELGDRRGELNTLGNLGLFHLDSGDVPRAIAYYEQALAMARELSDRRGEGIILANTGLAYTELGDMQRALTAAEQALAIARELGDRRGEGIALSLLGRTYAERGDAQCTIESCGRALAIAEEIGNQRLKGQAQFSLARAYAMRGDLALAITAFEAAIAIFHEVGDRAGEAECQWHFGLALAGWGEQEWALSLLHAAIAYEEEIGHTKVAAHAAQLARLEAQGTAAENARAC